jgi:hypothetical protein
LFPDPVIGKTFLISLWSFFHEAQRTLFPLTIFQPNPRS